MRNKSISKLLSAAVIAITLPYGNAFALNISNDLNSCTSGINPTKQGNKTTIITTSNIDLYNWSSFNIKKNETVDFVFTNSGQTAINHLSPGANPSSIKGAITSSGSYKGSIFLFNPNGIVISKNASVNNIGTFFVSTNKFNGVMNSNITFSEPDSVNALNVKNIKMSNVDNAFFVGPGVEFSTSKNLITNKSFNIMAIGAGNYNISNEKISNKIATKKSAFYDEIIKINTGTKSIISGDINIEARGNYEGSTDIIINRNLIADSAIASKNGSIYIVASNSNLSENTGAQMVLNGKLGGESANVHLEAKEIVLNGEIDVSGQNGGNIEINSKSFDQHGNIKAAGINGKGGQIEINSTKYTGIKEASVDSSGKTQGGDIKLLADYQILSSGSYKAISEKGKGGNIKLSAPLLKLLATDIDASGNTGGGEILLGGEFKGGANLEEDVIPNSLLNTIGDGSIVKSNCTGNNGDGGTVIIWSDNTTNAFGVVEAKGGSSSGKGGLVEISGKESFNFAADVDTGGGNLLLDPKNIIISDKEIGGIVYNSILHDDSSILPPQTLDLDDNDGFGYSTALYENFLAVGAWGDDTGGDGRGAVYLFNFDSGTTYDNLTLDTKLADGTPLSSGGTLSLSDNDNFGSSVAIYENFLAVGAHGDDTGGTDRGAAYLFSFDSGTTYDNLALNTKLAEGTALVSGGNLSLNDADAFGRSVAIYENFLAVGAHGDDTGGTDRGAAYLFSFDSGTNYNNLALNTKLTNGSVVDGGVTLTLNDENHFGNSVALYDNLFAIGSKGDNTGGTGRGAAYLFSFDSGTTYDNLALNTKLSNGSSLVDGGTLSLSDDDNFGSSVAIYDNLFVVGAEADDTGGDNRGAAYLFSFDSGTTYSNIDLDTKLVDGSSLAGGGTLSLNNNDNFGSSVALYDDLLSVGAAGDSTGGTRRGAAHMFKLIGNDPEDYTFSAYPSDTLYLSISNLNALLNTQNVILQANNDINLLSDITGGNYDLTLQSGRSIDLQGDINIDNADLTIIANETAAAGVIDAYRDEGLAEITTSNINVGNGDVTIQLKAGDDKTNFESGDIVLDDIMANEILILNEGLTSGSDIIINSDSVLNASGINNPLTLSTANGTFINNADENCLSANNGRWLIYSDNNANTLLKGLEPNDCIYGATYESTSPQSVSEGNYLLLRNGEPTINNDISSGSVSSSSSSSNAAVAIAIPIGVAAAGLFTAATYPSLLGFAAPIKRNATNLQSKPNPLITSSEMTAIPVYDKNGNIKYLRIVKKY